jgi:hypothetical protein
MLKHVVNHKSGRRTDGSSGYTAMRPWIHNEARVSAQENGGTSGTGQQLAARQ